MKTTNISYNENFQDAGNSDNIIEKIKNFYLFYKNDL